MSEVRLIDANALDDSFRHSIVKCKQWFKDAAVLGEEESKARADQAYVTFMECSMRLKKQPTIDAVPVVHAYWIIKPHGTYGQLRASCSACGKHSGIGGIVSNQKKPYCPNCGAIMDGKEIVDG